MWQQALGGIVRGAFGPGAKVVQVLPERMVKVMLQPLSAVHAVPFVPFLTPRISYNMRAMLHEDFRRSWVRRNLNVLYQSVIDLLRMPRHCNDRLVAQLGALENEEELKHRRATGTGCILLGLHFGNHRFLAPGLAALGYPISNLIGGFPQPRVGFGQSTQSGASKFRTTYIEKSKVDYIRPSDEPAKRTIDVLVERAKQGRFLLLLADGCMGKRRVQVPFMGCEIGLPVGAAIIADRAGVPLVPILAVPGSHKVVIGDPVSVNSSSTQTAMQSVMASFESTVRSEPWQWWTWFHLDLDRTEHSVTRWRLLSGAEAFALSLRPHANQPHGEP